MQRQVLSPDERQHILEKFIEKYLARGYRLISHSPTTAELFKPEAFPAFLNKEQNLFVDIDEYGRIFVRKS